jgi:hypothetical protein
VEDEADEEANLEEESLPLMTLIVSLLDMVELVEVLRILTTGISSSLSRSSPLFCSVLGW